MTHAIDNGLARVFPAAPWLMLPAKTGEVVKVLSEALNPDWVVEREVDCQGEISIIALPAKDTGRLPAFLLYEKDGQTRVATIACDEWQSDCGFTSFSHAIEALISDARRIIARQPGQPPTRRIRSTALQS